jgi:hypothetical protein
MVERKGGRRGGNDVGVVSLEEMYFRYLQQTDALAPKGAYVKPEDKCDMYVLYSTSDHGGGGGEYYLKPWYSRSICKVSCIHIHLPMSNQPSPAYR